MRRTAWLQAPFRQTSAMATRDSDTGMSGTRFLRRRIFALLVPDARRARIGGPVARIG